MKCGMKSQFQTSVVVPLKFGNGKLIASKILLGMWCLSIHRWKFIHVNRGGPYSCHSLVPSHCVLSFSEVTWLVGWWSGSEIRLFLDDVETMKVVGKEHNLMLSNHKYEVDWCLVWLIAERLGLLPVSSFFVQGYGRDLGCHIETLCEHIDTWANSRVGGVRKFLLPYVDAKWGRRA